MGTTNFDRLRTNFLGEIACAKVELRALEKGFTVFRSIVECRYDRIIDDGRKLWRTQIKYANQRCPSHVTGAFELGLRKWRGNGRKTLPSYTTDEIDLLLVFVPRIDQILWFGPEVFAGRSRLQIRFEPTKNNQKKGCLMALDYVW